MNKFLALLFLLGAIGGFGMAARRTYEVRDQTPWGTPVGPVRTAEVGKGDRLFFIGLGFTCLLTSAYLIVRLRRHDTRR